MQDRKGKLTGQSGVFVNPVVLERAARALEHEEVLDTSGQGTLKSGFPERVVDGDGHDALLIAVAHERVLVGLARDRDARPLELYDVDVCLVDVGLMGSM